jgi:hypothetical protein
VTTPGSDLWARRSWLVSLAAVLALAIALAPGLAGASPDTSPKPGSSQVEGVKPLVLAHYYIWFTPGSWNRAKKDVPLAGRYSSDDIDVMRTHVKEAQAAGIDGFIVSWKSTPDMDSRLADLVTVAAEQGFKLAITYQGLDFNRVPLPAARIAADLGLLADTYGNDSVFDIFGKPLVVLTGTSVMTRATVGKIAEPHRKRLLILASDKSVASYERIADLVDGNLYYWSSVNPYNHNGYAEKLISFGDAVRAHDGIWVAPAAPGFDARLVGGTSSIDRRDGETLRAEWNAAISSRPAAIGVISWNEFSENTHVEPSRAYGNRYLDVLPELTGAAKSPSAGPDSNEPMGPGSPLRAILAVGGITGLTVASLVALVRRRGKPRYSPRRRQGAGVMNGAVVGATIGCLAATLGYLGYGAWAPLRAEPPPPAVENLSSRPAAKSTCPQAIVTRPPSGMHLSERELVPFSSTQLGVKTVIDDATGTAEPPSRTIEVVSGGYVDELTESYDNLRPLGMVSVMGQPVNLLAGSLLNSTVMLVIWREPGVAPPCDVHAVLATNLSEQQFKAVVKSVRPKHSLASTKSFNQPRR